MNKPLIILALEDIRDSYGGPIRSIENLANLYDKAGYRVVILQANFAFTVQNNRFTKCYEVHTLWWFFRCLFVARLGEQPVLVLNNQWSPGVQLLGTVSWLFGIRFLWWIRGVIKIDTLRKRVVWRITQSHLINHAHKVVIASTVAKERVLALPRIREHCFITIPNLVEIPEVGSLDSKVKGKNSTLRGLYLGRLHEKKRIHSILENLPKMLNGHTLKITVAGYADDPNYIKKLQTIADERKLELEFRLNVSDSEKKVLLSSHDFFVSLSQMENFGISVLEALRFGLPTIVHQDTDFWPHSKIDNVLTVKNDDLEYALAAVATIVTHTSARERADCFFKVWEQLQLRTRSDILSLVEK